MNSTCPVIQTESCIEDSLNSRQNFKKEFKRIFGSFFSETEIEFYEQKDNQFGLWMLGIFSGKGIEEFWFQPENIHLFRVVQKITPKGLCHWLYPANLRCITSKCQTYTQT